MGWMGWMDLMDLMDLMDSKAQMGTVHRAPCSVLRAPCSVLRAPCPVPPYISTFRFRQSRSMMAHGR
jgi:hypothetical protein